jgi:hypothetical protein
VSYPRWSALQAGYRLITPQKLRAAASSPLLGIHASPDVAVRSHVEWDFVAQLALQWLLKEQRRMGAAQALRRLAASSHEARTSHRPDQTPLPGGVSWCPASRSKPKRGRFRLSIR